MNRALGSALVIACASACHAPAVEQPPGAAAAAPSAAAPAIPHGDHNPHHGGIVMMKEDLHYELVVDPSGRVQLFFSDAVREDLPASIASTVLVTLHRLTGPDQTVPLQIDQAGESWAGSGRPVLDPAQTTARVSFTIRNQPYSIDLPLAAATAR